MTARRYIEAGKADLPDNFIVVEGSDWKSALSRIEKGVRKSPVNYGNFYDPSFHPPAGLETLLTKLRDKNHLNFGTVGCSTKKAIDKTLSEHFNKIVAGAGLNSQEQGVLKTFFLDLQNVMNPVLDVWPGKTNISLSFRGNETSLSKPNPQFALGTASNELNWRALPFFGSTFFVRMSFNTAANAIYDDKNVVKARDSKYRAGGLKHFDKEKVNCKPGEEWYPKPWSISVLTPNIWTHRPVVQSSPRTVAPKQPEKRFTVQMAIQRL